VHVTWRYIGAELNIAQPAIKHNADISSTYLRPKGPVKQSSRWVYKRPVSRKISLSSNVWFVSGCCLKVSPAERLHCLIPFIKRTVRSRPNFGHYTETNTMITAAAAFRRPSPPSERRQLGGKLTVRCKDIETNSSSHRPSIRSFADDKSS
jgi:hypothetical protein